MATAPHFTPAFFTFLRQLKSHNTREWFLANRERYLADVEGPMLRFITDAGDRLRAISPMMAADPRRSGGSLYRIYRDTRFSADKTPYKTWSACHFKHRGAAKGQPAPGFYLHLGPAERFGGGGIYHPDMPTLTKIRQRIAADSKGWSTVVKAGLDIEGDTLTRAPAGFDPAHKFIDDLKRKDFYAGEEYTDRDVLSTRFLDRFVESCQKVAPLMAFLSKALDLRW